MLQSMQLLICASRWLTGTATLQSFLHLAQKWSTNPNDPASGYVNSTEYNRIMSDSIFTPCPKVRT